MEESGILKNDIVLAPLMDYVWHPMDMEMHVFYGTLKQDVLLKEEAHPLHWISIEENFFNISKFAGEGNIGHMLMIWRMAKEIGE
jgi:8-oxo-dGTP diphosphatase